jgi:putative membrane protein
MTNTTVEMLNRTNADALLRASAISRFSISSPPVVSSFGACIVLGFFEFALLAFGPPGLDLPSAAIAALLGVLFPAIASGAATFNFMRQIGATITLGRVMLLAAMDVAIVFAFTIVGSAVTTSTHDAWTWAIVTAVAFAASVKMLVLGATSDPRIERALAPSLVLPGLCLAIFSGLGILTPVQATLGIMFVLVFAGFSALWVGIVIAPFARNFAEDGLALLHSLLDAWAGWSKPSPASPAVGTVQMEAFFARNGRPREVRFEVLRFRQEGGRKVLWFCPELHPGPYADLGGSDLPAKAAAGLARLADETVVFHGASTHDENPTGRDQLSKVFEAVGPTLEKASSEERATRSIRVERAGVTVLAQRIGKLVILGATRAPKSSDDVDLGVGRNIATAVAGAGLGRALFLDGHNCVDEGLGRTELGSKEARELEEGCLHAAADVAKLKEAPLSVGFANAVPDATYLKEFAIGRRGICVTVLESGGHKTGYVLIDGNNLKAGLRSELLRAVERAVDRAEVFTTDNHAVNTTMGADNEVGSRRDNVVLIKEVERLTLAAVADLKLASAECATGTVQDVQVFGEGLALKISATINAAVAVMTPAYVATTAAAFLACSVLAALLT